MEKQHAQRRFRTGGRSCYSGAISALERFASLQAFAPRHPCFHVSPCLDQEGFRSAGRESQSVSDLLSCATEKSVARKTATKKPATKKAATKSFLLRASDGPVGLVLHEIQPRITAVPRGCGRSEPAIHPKQKLKCAPERRGLSGKSRAWPGHAP